MTDNYVRATADQLEQEGLVGPSEASETHRKVELIRASTLEMTRPSYLWEPRIPDCAVSLLAGLEGLGKTLIAVWLMARVTRGQLEGSRRGSPGDVIYVGIEDDWSSRTLPRLVAAGADTNRVHFVAVAGGGVFSVENDLHALEAAMEPLKDSVALVVIDPLDAHLGEGVDSHRKSEVQRAFQLVAASAQAFGLAVVGIGHLNKNELSRDVLMRVIGSKGFTTAARSVLAVGEHPDNERESLLVLRKSNFTDRRAVPAWRYRIDTTTIGRGDEAREVEVVTWLGEEPDVDADGILSRTTSEERTERDEAADWLRKTLEGGPVAYKEIERMAEEDGIARATLHRAKELAGVVIERDQKAKGRPSTWRLQVSSHQDDLDSSQSQTQPIETKYETPVTSEDGPQNAISSHVSRDKEPQGIPLVDYTELIEEQDFVSGWNESIASREEVTT